MFTFGRGQTKNPPSKWDEKEFPEGRKLKQGIKSNHKTYKE